MGGYGSRVFLGMKTIFPSDVIETVNGFFFIQFANCAAMEEVIDGGPWLFQGQPIVLQKWTPGLALRKHGHTQVSIWVKLRHLPVELWTTEGLSMMYPDAITKAGTRLHFARAYRVDVEYEWTPSKCHTCRSLGHTTVDCLSTKKPAKPPVAVYVQKPPNRTPKESSTVDEPAVVIPAMHATDGVDSHDNSPRFSPTAHKVRRLWFLIRLPL
ncbi:UNVERIFIED_CONTAM: hypothetical protein Slati_2467300 [Sesamum latifolium]|uniref:DUF4283 domain-containing protein n=1 Tax=Sesamum latifolium TaxID=2727402 RepID=A0AAW2WDR6_9LAMI